MPTTHRAERLPWTAFSQELDDLGSRHVVGVDTNSSTADRLSGRPSEICAHRRRQNDRNTATYFRAAAAQGNSAAHFNLGNLLTRQGQLDSAAEHLGRAWTAGTIDAALNLGLVLQTLHRDDEAEVAFRHGWEAGDEGAGHELAWCLHGRGDTDGARRVFRTMSRQKSYLGRKAAGILGTWAAMNGKRNKKTIKRLERGLWAYQDAAPELAAIFAERGDVQGARELLEEHIVYSPRPSVALGNLLNDHYGDREGAVTALLIGVAAGDAHARDNLDELQASPDADD